MATLADDLYNGDNYLEGLDEDLEPVDVELVDEEPPTKGKGHKVKRTLSYLDQARNSANLTRTDKIGLLAGGSLGASLLTLFVVLGIIPFLFTIASKPAPVLVQTADGKTMRVLALEGNQRSPLVIKDAVTVMMSKLFTWRNFLTPYTSEELVNPKADPGIQIPAKNGFPGGRMPTEVWQATFSLSADFQGTFIHTLTKMVGDARIYAASGGSQVSLEIMNISNPVSIGDGLWRVLIVGNLVKIDALNKVPTRVRFNKEVFVRAVPIPIIREEGKPLEKTLSQITAEAKASGLEIYAMRDAERVELIPGGAPPPPSPLASPNGAVSPSPSVKLTQ
jgi:hypothetical protein